VVNYDVGGQEWKWTLSNTCITLGTGRFGEKGTAINLIDDQRSIEVLAAIESHFIKMVRR
jgi:hypothetical protein